ncbi:MAG: glutathione S-transferase N-terminal domain-containing protein [Novosphingobium sp.]|nr:glutathione S-transferase N-terminal domain-containing protein [Novosphingobium sp.]
MITLYYVSSPNVHKVCIALEEMGLAYDLQPIDVSKNEHRDRSKVGGAKYGRLPIIRDEDPVGGGEPVVTFESGAILQYLAEKTGQFLPQGDVRARQQVLQWLFWQMGGIGPIGGQLFHFRAFAPVIAPDFDNSYAKARYEKMWSALLELMNEQLGETAYLAGAYSIADMACHPWIDYLPPEAGLDAFPNVQRWLHDVSARPAVVAAYARAFALDTGYARNEKGASQFPAEGIFQHVVVT